ncbi:MAG TPA: CocE/NonD family hydrolase [Mycobacteriales bacterium]|nr:CocE/NonD family hydrolase [Mycobacteriales bacterium]
MTASRQRWNVDVAMRDGVVLRADVYFPPGGVDGGPYPVVLARTPYGKQNPVYVDGARYLCEHGYACVLQDTRGRHDSEGSWEPFGNEGRDGYDTVEWCAAQPWSTGRVGTMGGSYGGWVQWSLAREKPPHLTAMVSTASCGAWLEELPFNNGCVMLVMLGWLSFASGRVMQNPQLVQNWHEVFRHLPLREMPTVLGRDLPLWSEWLDHPSLDEYWRELRLDDAFAHIDTPVLHITGWWDDDQPGALSMYRGMVSGSPGSPDQALMIGAWDHAGTRLPRQVLGGVDMGPDAVHDVLDIHRRWFDRWLKQTDDTTAPVRLYLTGRYQWVETVSFPPPGTAPLVWHLDSGGRANSLMGDGTMGPAPACGAEEDVYRYDPADPVPAVIDENFYSPTVVETPLDHRFKHRRDDVLVYTSDPVSDELAVVGHAEVQLHAATDGPDTDWFVALHDVAPNGTSMVLSDGRLRARYAEDLATPRLREPGRVYAYTIRTGAIGHVVRPGHRLRLTVTSSDFPVWDRNLNTGDAIADGTKLRVATNRVRHTPDEASSVTLPIAPPGLLD